MHLINFDGYIPYDEDSFQQLVKSLKQATDDADAAYTAIHDDLNAYLALLAFNARYLIMRDKARVREFVGNELKATVRGGDALPGDEIEAAIDALYLDIVNSINNAARNVEGRSPDIQFAYNLPVDHGPGMLFRPFLATELFRAQGVAKALRDYRSATLRPAITREYRRARGILGSAESVSGPLGVAPPPDPLADAAKLPKRFEELGQLAAKKHAGLLEFRHFAEAALTRAADAKADAVIAAFRVTATNLPGATALLQHWTMMTCLSNWALTANTLSVVNNAGFVMRARVVYLLNGSEDATDWTDSYPIGDARRIELNAHPKHRSARFQVEVDAKAGVTRRGPPMFQSLLADEELAEVNVQGGTLTYDIGLS